VPAAVAADFADGSEDRKEVRVHFPAENGNETARAGPPCHFIVNLSVGPDAATDSKAARR
jgi:hypothetical protein